MKPSYSKTTNEHGRTAIQIDKRPQRFISKRSAEVGERGDCSVRALAAAIGDDSTSYDLAHECMELAGRERRKGAKTIGQCVKAFEIAGFICQEVQKSYPNAKTTKSAERNLPKTGTYLVYVRGHVLTIKNGRVYCDSKGRQHRVKKIYRVTSR